MCHSHLQMEIYQDAHIYICYKCPITQVLELWFVFTLNLVMIICHYIPVSKFKCEKDSRDANNGVKAFLCPDT